METGVPSFGASRLFFLENNFWTYSSLRSGQFSYGTTLYRNYWKETVFFLLTPRVIFVKQFAQADPFEIDFYEETNCKIRNDFRQHKSLARHSNFYTTQVSPAWLSVAQTSWSTTQPSLARTSNGSAVYVNNKYSSPSICHLRKSWGSTKNRVAGNRFIPRLFFSADKSEARDFLYLGYNPGQMHIS